MSLGLPYPPDLKQFQSWYQNMGKALSEGMEKEDAFKFCEIGHKIYGFCYFCCADGEYWNLKMNGIPVMEGLPDYCQNCIRMRWLMT